MEKPIIVSPVGPEFIDVPNMAAVNAKAERFK